MYFSFFVTFQFYFTETQTQNIRMFSDRGPTLHFSLQLNFEVLNFVKKLLHFHTTYVIHFPIFITLAENYIYTFIIIDGNLDNNEIYVYLENSLLKIMRIRILLPWN